MKKQKSLDYKKYFEGKKITLMGLGGFGRALEEAKFLAESGAKLLITENREKKFLKKEIKVLSKYKNISYTFGGHKKLDFKNRDLVFFPNSLPLQNQFRDYAEKNSKVVTKTIAYVFYIVENEKKNLNIKTIGVTGTKGKSSVTAMIEKLIKDSGKNVYIGGNIRGASNLPILKKIKDGDFLLAELDSWLLQGFGYLKISPNISIFTNFFRDHLDYYKKNMEKYFKDKSFIFKYQKKEDFLIISSEAKQNISKYFKAKIESKILLANEKNLTKIWKDKKHFGEVYDKNFALAKNFGELLKISENKIKNSLKAFKAVEGRMEILKSKKGIIFINDNNSTTPDSSKISLKILKEKYPNKKIFLISGGADKEFLFKDFSKEIEKKVSYVIFFEGSGTEKIIKNFSKKNIFFEISNSMKKAFNKIVEKAKKGDIVILSPGCASFGVFKNEYDRNDQFLKEYKNLK